METPIKFDRPRGSGGGIAMIQIVCDSDKCLVGRCVNCGACVVIGEYHEVDCYGDLWCDYCSDLEY